MQKDAAKALIIVNNVEFLYSNTNCTRGPTIE